MLIAVSYTHLDVYKRQPANLKRWDDLVYELAHPQGDVNIVMVGKYVELSDSYKSLNEALRHAGMKNHVRVKIDYIDSETITPDNVAQLAKFDAILVLSLIHI